VLPEPDPDAAPLATALRARGHTPIEVAWDDPRGSLDALDVLVIRSPWNYHERPEDFLRWMVQAAARVPLINPIHVVRWNIHKGYLARLAEAEVPVVPTLHIGKGAFRPSVVEAMMSDPRGVVIKPAIGAASVGVHRFPAEERAAAMARLEEVVSKTDALVQPYLEGFRDPGERSLIWIDSAWTHAILKRPRFAGSSEQVDCTEPPTAEEIAVGNRALASAPPGCGYARVDLVQDAQGSILLSELELMEPSLYFGSSPEALARFVAMIERRGATGKAGGPSGTA
jgi:glutathione synthase/RimK-type ligase-like ATP-grasp enzyme